MKEIPIQLLALFAETAKEQATEIAPIINSGSNRRYYQMKSKNNAFIGVFSDEVSENNAFIYLANHFSAKNLPVPKVLAVSEDRKYYLQTNLGSLSLFDYVSEGRKSGNFSEKEQAMLYKTIALLPEFQVKGAQGLDFSQCYPLASLDRQTVMWDLNYFKYCFLKPSGIEFSEWQLERDFESLASEILADKHDTFLYRDFQSRNVMIQNGEPYFIDFQGGRKGAIYYDVVSFVWQAKANFPSKLREDLIQTYLAALKKLMPVDETKFAGNVTLFALFRTLQVLGAYGFRGLIEKKPHFIESIPFAIRNLEDILQNDFSRFPCLVETLKKLIDKHCHCGLDPQSPSKHEGVAGQARNDKDSSLLVTIYSFSYKKGIPEDNSGNGGGFVFDCRAIHNPGRYQEYKTQTGLDNSVRDFLENDGEIVDFLSSVKKLTDASVSRYIERGFSSLMISFGCTGGQHRSVYCAQDLAEYIAKKFSVKVKLIHREQKIEQDF